MKFVIQRVTNASCTVDGNITGSIQKGFLVLIGISDHDTIQIADKMIKKLLGMRIFDHFIGNLYGIMIKKLLGMRIFEDSDGKTNLSLHDVNGELLLISQFTLYADCKKGNRPSFTNAGKPDIAKQMYEYIIDQCKKEIPVVEQGIFGADMKISLLNDGPFTIILDSAEIDRKSVV